MKRYIIPLVLILITLVVATSDGARPTKQKALLSVSCPRCKFSKYSYDERELVDLMKTHVSSHHKMVLTDQEIKQMIRSTDEIKKPDTLSTTRKAIPPDSGLSPRR